VAATENDEPTIHHYNSNNHNGRKGKLSTTDNQWRPFGSARLLQSTTDTTE